MAPEYLELPVLPVDGPGTDVGERHDVVQMSLALRYHVTNPATRRRGGRTHRRDGRPIQREELLIHRAYTINVGPEALDPDRGPLLIAEAVARFIYRRLKFEGFPIRIREHEGDIRPGAPPRP